MHAVSYIGHEVMQKSHLNMHNNVNLLFLSFFKILLSTDWLHLNQKHILCVWKERFTEYVVTLLCFGETYMHQCKEVLCFQREVLNPHRAHSCRLNCSLSVYIRDRHTAERGSEWMGIMWKRIRWLEDMWSPASLCGRLSGSHAIQELWSSHTVACDLLRLNKQQL